MKQQRVAMSACLGGEPCRYDGKSKGIAAFRDCAAQATWLSVCPEQLGGLPTPRVPAEIVGGDGYDVLNGRARVVNAQGEDVTTAFIRGAYRTLALIQAHGAQFVILKQNSPSCGSRAIYDGYFRKQLRQGDGVTSALLRWHGYEVNDEDDEKRCAE